MMSSGLSWLRDKRRELLFFYAKPAFQKGMQLDRHEHSPRKEGLRKRDNQVALWEV